MQQFNDSRYLSMIYLPPANIMFYIRVKAVWTQEKFT